MIIDIKNLTVSFHGPGGAFTAVRDISLSLEEGRSLAIVGESGSGKSVTALSLARLLPSPPAKIEASKFMVAGKNVPSLTEPELRRMRGKDVAYIFQDPTASLNPVFTIGAQVKEALALHRPDVPASSRDQVAAEWLGRVGIRDPLLRLNDYPHQFSGGMLQRVMIAMALCCQPKLVVADEPTTALDVTLQRQIMQLLAQMKKEIGLSIILITHNFGIIRDVADEVAVMFRGEVVETGPVEKILTSPVHPYTQALLACVPRLNDNRKRLATIDYELIDRG
jgi:ABC-type dipeptide/oligopeptide/nickel transport system ATPase component